MYNEAVAIGNASLPPLAFRIIMRPIMAQIAYLVRKSSLWVPDRKIDRQDVLS